MPFPKITWKNDPDPGTPVGATNLNNLEGRIETAIDDVEAAIAASSGGGSTEIVPGNIQTSNYTLVLTDAGKIIIMNAASARSITIPPAASVGFEDGTVIAGMRYGAGDLSVVAGSGVTIRDPDGAGLGVQDQYGVIALRKHAANEWVVIGGGGASGGGGGLTDIARAGARVFDSDGQTIPTAVETNLNFDSERWDTDGYHDNVTNNHRLTVPGGKAGLYLVGVSVQFNANLTGNRILYVKDNAGNYLIRDTVPPAVAGTPTRMTRQTMWPLVDGGFVFAAAYQDSGGDLAIPASGAFSMEFFCQRLAA